MKYGTIHHLWSIISQSAHSVKVAESPSFFFLQQTVRFPPSFTPATFYFTEQSNAIKIATFSICLIGRVACVAGVLMMDRSDLSPGADTVGRGVGKGGEDG